MLRIGRLLHAERTADAISQHPDLVAPDAEHLGDVVAKPEYALAADIKGPVSALRIILRVIHERALNGGLYAVLGLLSRALSRRTGPPVKLH